MRFTGDTGIACHLLYNKETGRLREVDLEAAVAAASAKANKPKEDDNPEF